MRRRVRLAASAACGIIAVLLAAAQSCQTTGHGFVVSDPSEDFDAALAMLGVDPSQLTRNAVA